MNDRPRIERRIHNARYRRAVRRVLTFMPRFRIEIANQNTKQASGGGKNPHLSPGTPRPS